MLFSSQMKCKIRVHALLSMVLLCYSISNISDGIANSSDKLTREDLLEAEVTSVVITGINRTQNGSFTLRTNRLLKYSSKSSQDMVNPNVVQTNDKGGFRKITADFGEYTRAAKILKLYGNVVIEEKLDDFSESSITSVKTITISLDDWE